MRIGARMLEFDTYLMIDVYYRPKAPLRIRQGSLEIKSLTLCRQFYSAPKEYAYLYTQEGVNRLVLDLSLTYEIRPIPRKKTSLYCKVREAMA